MRTPLNAIIGMSDLMRDTPLNREQADMLQTLRSSSRVMLASSKTCSTSRRSRPAGYAGEG